MKSASVTLLAAWLLIAGSNAIQLSKRENPPVVGIRMQRKTVESPFARDIVRRSATTISETLDNEQTLYFANVSVGTPEQALRLQIDTGSSDLWTNAASSSLCKAKGDQCSISGTYDANSSSTYSYVSSDFNISYVDGSGAVGDYVTDTLQFGGQSLTDMQFGVGYQSDSPEGILGIGYTVNEVQVNRNNQQAYPNLPQLLANKGLIQSNAYSLWLDDLEASTGSVLFGGVDTDKYHGSLATLPIQKEEGTYQEFIITLTAVGVSFNGKSQSLGSSSNLPAPVLLDAGSSLSYLPNDIATALYAQFNAQFDNQAQAAYVDCSLANNASTVDFTFSSPIISVPMSELVINPGPNPDGSAATFADGTAACAFGISPAGDTTAVLGDTFLRSAYVVYDLANNEISLAQTNFNATGSNVSAIGTGSASVPDATGVANAASATQTVTGGARIHGPSGTVTVSGSSTSSTSTSTARGGAAATQVPYAVLAGFAGAALVLA
ncbi:hypothetical protein MMC12_003710 [Toensbergia leucococca]|nr:hypothetical protein [Toensbergia leucococca]